MIGGRGGSSKSFFFLLLLLLFLFFFFFSTCLFYFNCGVGWICLALLLLGVLAIVFCQYVGFVVVVSVLVGIYIY